MLRWLLVIAMALLPWHGWAGAGVAAAFAAGPQPAVQASGAFASLAGHAAHHPGQAEADCLDDAEAARDHHAAAGPDGGCPGCSMCHSCSPVALPAISGVPPAGSAAPQRPAGAASRFASADRGPGLKPPIS